METEITKRVGAGWRNWNKCSGVLCDIRMQVKLKGKVYKTVIRSAMLYGAETWDTTKRQENRMRRNFYLKSNKMVNTTLANSLLRRLHTQYVQHNIQYLQQIYK